IGPRDVLMEIVPDDKRLIIEARIRPDDINHVRHGSHADIRLTAYKQRTTPLVQGSVVYVSGDRMVDEQTKQPYYVVHVDVSAKSLASAGNLTLQAGMPAEVFIRTDERSTYDYLTAPVTSYLRRAMRISSAPGTKRWRWASRRTCSARHAFQGSSSMGTRRRRHTMASARPSRARLAAAGASPPGSRSSDMRASSRM